MNDQPTTPGSLAGIFTPPAAAPVAPTPPANPEPAPAPTPAPAAPASPAGVGSLADIFAPKVQPVANPATPPAAQPGTPAATPSTFSIEDFVSRHVADPETLFQGDGRKIAQFKDLRGIAEGAMRELAAAQLELNQLRATGGSGSAQPGTGTILPETEAIQKLTGELEALKPAAQRWQEHEARQNLRQNPAFRSEFDQPRAAILREIEATASEIGLEKKDVEEFLRLDTEFKQARWIKDHVEDDVAADLYKEKGRQFLGLSVQAKAVLESADPIATLREWDDYSNAFATKFAAKLGENAAKELQAASSRVLGSLAQGTDPFFTTDSGKAVIQELNKRAAEGHGFTADEVVEAVAKSKSASAYMALAQSFRERLIAAETELQRYRQASPTPPRFPDPTQGGGAPAPKVDSFGFGQGGGGIQPLVRADQIRTA